MLNLLIQSTLETLYMVAGATVFSLVLGFPLGVLLCVTSPDGLMPNTTLSQVMKKLRKLLFHPLGIIAFALFMIVTGLVYGFRFWHLVVLVAYLLYPVFVALLSVLPNINVNPFMGRIVNVLRSFPFIILMILVFPLSRVIVGTSIGTTAAIVPLSVAAAPFVARIIESALKEVDPQVVQAARVMGSTNWQIVRKVMIPEAMPALVAGITLTIINIIGYSAMAGAIGGGGLGDLAIRYGYQRFRLDLMIGAVVVIIVMVEMIQFTGTRIADNMIRKR